MLPTVKILGRTYPMYGLMGVLGFLMGMLFIVIRGNKRDKAMTDDAVYIYTWGGIGMLAGAKILYLITVFPSFLKDLSSFSENPALFINQYLSGGMVFYGGLIGALIGACIAAHVFNRKLSDLYALLVPSIALMAGFGRIGCFCEGCCYGKPTDLPIGIVFTHSPVAPNGIRLLPVQLMEAGFDFFLFFLLAYITRKENKPDVLVFYLLVYAGWRFIIEFFRGDVIRGSWGGLSTSQWISMGMILVLIIQMMIRKSLKKQTRIPVKLR